MTQIILVRHGETEWNESSGERLRGRANLDLCGLGIRQARATAARIREWQVDAVYSSPLQRAVATAMIITEGLELEVESLDTIIDVDYGRWQGLSLKDAERDNSEMYSLFLRSPHLVTFPDGESLGHVRTRVITAINIILPQAVGRTVVLVSHKVVCKVLLCVLLDLDDSHFWQMEQHPCGISQIDTCGGVPVLTLLNDTCHLRGVT